MVSVQLLIALHPIDETREVIVHKEVQQQLATNLWYIIIHPCPSLDIGALEMSPTKMSLRMKYKG